MCQLKSNFPPFIFVRKLNRSELNCLDDIKIFITQNNFHGEEHQLYIQHLNNLQKIYAELLVLINKRMTDLETLQDFLQSATNELVWLNEKEETEITRDWSDKNLDLSSVHHYYEV